MEFKRSVISAAVLGATVFSGNALAGSTSVNFGAMSDYMFRGLAQSGGASGFGGIDYAADSGFYAGAWAATINFAGDAQSGAGSELDLYAGFGGESGALGYDFGVIYYLYTEADEAANTAGTSPADPGPDTIELYGSLSAGMFSLGFYFAPDTYFGADDSAYGVSVGFSAPITDNATFDASIQTNGGDGNEGVLMGYGFSEEDYIDYSFGINAESESGLFTGIALVGTDLDDDDPKVVVSGGFAFDI